MVFLVSGSWQTVHARRMSQGFILGRQRSTRDLRNHEPRIDAAILDEKWWQPGQVTVEQQCSTPLGDRPDLRNSNGELVRCERDRLCVEVAARKNIAVVEDEWIVGCGIGF